MTVTGTAGVLARGGVPITDMAALIDSDLAAMRDDDPCRPLRYILVNEINYGDYVGANYQAALEYVLDALHAKYPQAAVYVARPWRQGAEFVAPTNDWATRIGVVVAARSWAHLGHDERVWLEGGDDGATMSVDGVHYSAAGIIECAHQWATVLGLPISWLIVPDDIRRLLPANDNYAPAERIAA
jgi:hypothetical protein